MVRYFEFLSASSYPVIELTKEILEKQRSEFTQGRDKMRKMEEVMAAKHAERIELVSGGFYSLIRVN